MHSKISKHSILSDYFLSLVQAVSFFKSTSGFVTWKIKPILGDDGPRDSGPRDSGPRDSGPPRDYDEDRRGYRDDDDHRDDRHREDSRGDSGRL